MKFSDGLAVEVECRSNRGELGQLQGSTELTGPGLRAKPADNGEKTVNI